MGKLSYTVAQLNEAIRRVFGAWADVSAVTATPEDVAQGKKFVTSDKILKEGTAIFNGGTSGKPIEISTADGMDTVLSQAASADVGKIYKYTGTTTSTYKNNDLYIITQES